MNARLLSGCRLISPRHVPDTASCVFVGLSDSPHLHTSVSLTSHVLQWDNRVNNDVGIPKSKGKDDASAVKIQSRWRGRAARKEQRKQEEVSVAS